MDLTTFDFILINTSAGKDSQVMLDLVANDAAAQGVSDRVLAVHCDLGRAEWAGVAELAAEQCEHYGVPLRIVKRPQGDLVEQIRKRGMFPSSSARYCTSDQKRGQVYKVLTSLVKESGITIHRLFHSFEYARKTSAAFFYNSCFVTLKLIENCSRNNQGYLLHLD